MTRVLTLTRKKIYERNYIEIIVGRFIKRGKKDKINKLVLFSLFQLKVLFKKDHNFLFKLFFKNLRPVLQLKPKFSSGIVYMLPSIITISREYSLALLWFFKAVNERLEYSLQERFVEEYIKVIKGFGTAIDFRLKYYKLIIENRGLLFRFKK